MKEITVSELNQGQRIDKFMRKYLNDAPLSFIYKLFRIKDIKVNGKRVDINYILKSGDVVRIYVSDEQLSDFVKPHKIENIAQQLSVVYEDDNILIVNKPSGLLVHGDDKEKQRTLSNLVVNYLFGKGEYHPEHDYGFQPSPCHRLDRNTSGLVVFAKNMESLQQLEDLFKNKDEIKKEYLSLVAGRLNGEGKIDLPLLKNEKTKIVKVDKAGKTALTYYHSEEVFHDCSLMKVQIITGRTHQIRVHFAAINHPILGDSKYGNFALNRRFEEKFQYQNQFLHAYQLSFLNISGKLSYLSNRTFTAPLHQKEKNIIKELKEHQNDKLF